MAKNKPSSNKASNKWVSGTTPIYYWKDGTKLRLTDKSAVPVGAGVVKVYENINHIPQSIIDEIAAHNQGDINLTQYKDKNKTKITDEVKIGKLQSLESRSPTSKDQPNNDFRVAFNQSKLKSIPHATIKLYDGSSYWVSGGDTDNLHSWWTYEKYNPVLIPKPDIYSIPFYRIVNDVAILGHYQKEFIEYREPENRTNPLGGGNIAELNTIGKYACTGFNYFYNPSNNYGQLADGRHFYTHIGISGFEVIANAMYEGYFDRVLAEGGNNTYNPQLGKNHIMNLKVGVCTGENEYAVLSPTLRMDGYYTFTQPPHVIISGGQWINAVTGELYTYPQYGDMPSQIIGPQPFNEYGRSIQGRYSFVGRTQQFSKKYDEILHLSYHDEYGGYCDFNLSDTTNFSITRTRGDLEHNEQIIIPHNSSPTIEVVLIPAKWKFWVWLFGRFGTGTTTKWLCTSFEASAPSDMYGIYYAIYYEWDPPSGPYEWTWIDDLHYDDIFRRFMYYSPPSMIGLPQNNYNRWSDIWTPDGDITYGPVYTDPCIEDMVLCSRSLWLRVGSDIDGVVPTWSGDPSPSTYCPPGYSAWHVQRTAGQLVAIVRVLYDNGIIDYRYVYAKTNSTVDHQLMAYSHFYGQTKYGEIDGMAWITPTQFISDHSLSSPSTEDDIDSYYKTLYQWYISTYW